MGTWCADGQEHHWESYPKDLQSKALTQIEKCVHCGEMRNNPFQFNPTEPAE